MMYRWLFLIILVLTQLVFAQYKLSKDDEKFLDTLQHRSFLFLCIR